MRRRHRAWAQVDLQAFRHNLAVARARAGKASVWPVLKANAYGHGAHHLGLVCADEGVERIGVGDSGEALELREAGVRVPLLVLGTVIDAELPALLRHEVEVGVHSEGRVRGLGKFAREAGRVLGVHLKVDTGMTRLGVLPEAALRVAGAIKDEAGLALRGVMTHFAARDGFLDSHTDEQQARFDAVIGELRRAGIAVPAVHSANSAALFSARDSLGDAVRPGIALFGAMPPHFPNSDDLRPVLSLHAQIVFLKDIPPNTAVGYGGQWTAHRPTRLATLPIGYADGIPYRLGSSGRGTVLVRGRRCPIVGAISMDYCTVDVGHVPGVVVGDPVTFIGRDGEQRLSAQEVADAAGTIPYEITCSIGSRVERVYSDPLPQATSREQAPQTI